MSSQSIVKADGVKLNVGATISPVMMIFAITVVVLLQLSVAVHVTVVVLGVHRLILKLL